MLFVIIHGSYSSPDGNWFPDLKEKLEALGQSVLAPTFPVDSYESVTSRGQSTVPEHQSLSSWMQVFEEHLPIIRAADKVCMIGHSLGPLAILHAVSLFGIKLDSAIFVSPFFTKLAGAWQIDVANSTFYKADFDFDEVRKLIPLSYVLYSDNDPYVDKDHSLQFAASMGSSLIQVQKAGHMNAEVNLNEFPLVYELCKSRIDLTLYQRFLEHRKEIFAVPTTKGKTEEVIYLDPQEVQYEGIFHFRNLRRSGLATQYVNSRFWDPQSVYMEQARKAASRVPNFTRVMVYDKLADLKRPEVAAQLELDLAARIELYSISLENILQITPEYDFGVWDEEYVCFVHFNDEKDVREVKLSSRRDDIDKAVSWMAQILAKANKISLMSKG